jgi:hypothetical protein
MHPCPAHCIAYLSMSVPMLDSDEGMIVQYSWKIGGAIGSLMSVVNEQQKAVLSATRVFNTIRRKVAQAQRTTR